MTISSGLGSADRTRGFAACIALAFGLSAAPALGEEDCPRGDLDSRYCDRAGDLLADVPEDPVEWLDPRTIVFTYTPVEDPAVYERAWSGFMAHMSELTGRPVSYFSVHSYAAMVEAMRAGRLHVGGFATGSVPVAVNCAGAHPFATLGRGGQISGYEMEIITYSGSGIESIEDLRGRTLAFTTPTSNSGFRAPSALLEAEFGMVAEVDYEPVFSGAHDNSILGVAHGDYDAAAIANTVMHRMINRGVVSADQIETIYRSATFPAAAYSVPHNLHPELREKIEEAFFTFPWEGSELAVEFDYADGFVPVSYVEDWAIIRTIAQQVGDSFECQ